jgi:hypothetical protein
LTRHQARHLLAVSGDDDLLTALHQIEQLTELVLCLKGGADLVLFLPLVIQLAYSSLNCVQTRCSGRD